MCLATILFGYALMRRRGLERWLGAAGVVAAAALLVLNLASFPVPPAEADSVDLGPAVGIWFMLISLRILWVVGRRPAGAAQTANA